MLNPIFYSSQPYSDARKKRDWREKDKKVGSAIKSAMMKIFGYNAQ